MSEIKVNKITPRTGTTITLGDSGDSLSIASGVALTDFTSTGIDDNATSTALTINSSGNVGIGTSSINSKLDVRGTGAITLNVGSTDGTSARLTLDATNGDASGGDFPLLLSDGSDLLIEANNSTSDAEIRFRNNGSDAMRIDSSDNVLVGQSTVSTSSPGTIITQSGKSYHIATSDIALALDRKTTDGKILEFRRDQTVIGEIGSSASVPGLYVGDDSVALTFYNDNNIILPSGGSSLNKNGAISLGNATNRFNNLYLAGSVYLGGTGGANALDDYEEGTHQVSITGGTSGSASVGDNATRLKYIKIGNEVWVHGEIHITGISSIDGTVRVSLPFAVADTSDLAERSVGSCALRNINIRDDAVQVTPFCYGGQSFFTFRETIDNAVWQDIQGAALSSSDEFIVSLQYTTS